MTRLIGRLSKRLGLPEHRFIEANPYILLATARIMLQVYTENTAEQVQI